jgi:hypothetical protein
MMERIADDVVCYEHGTRLEYVGRENVREVCKAGLETGGGADIRWTIPELTVLARGEHCGVVGARPHHRLQPGG